MKNSSKTLQKIVAVAAAIIFAAIAFVAGYLVSKYTAGREYASYKWVIDTINDNYYGEFDGEDASFASLKAIGSLLDPYSEYYTREEYAKIKAENSGSKSGIGISYNFVNGEGAKIITVMGSSPAFRSGLRAGKILTGARDKDGNITEFKKSSDFTGFIDARGDNEKFTLYAGGEEYELAKEEYTASYACMYTSTAEWHFDYKLGKDPYLGSGNMDFLPHGAAYVRLTQFYGNAGSEFYKLMEKFNAAEKDTLFLDLRNNGGGYVDVMQQIAGCFTSSRGGSRLAMTARYKDGYEENYNCYEYSGAGLVKADTKVYVLANSGSASASEALIGALVSHGVLNYEDIFISDFSQEYLNYVGTGAKTARTYGKGIMQTTFVNHSTGEALKLTTAKIFWPNGKCIHDVGLTKEDGCRLVPAEWTATENDSEFRKVISEIYG